MKRFVAAFALILGPASAAAQTSGALAVLRSMTPAFESRVPAAPGAPVAKPAEAPQGWAEVLELVRRHGDFDPGDGVFVPPNLGLRDIRGPLSGSHRADYVNMWGGPDEDGNFSGLWVSMVSEDWRLGTDRVWRIGQWVLTLDMEGRLVGARHSLIVKTRDGQVLSMDLLPDSESGAAAELEALIRQWRGFSPR